MTIPHYKYYLIDIDRTLWDFDTNSEMAIHRLVERHESLHKKVMEIEGKDDHLHKFFVRYDALNNKLWEEYELGAITKDILRWMRFHKAFLLYGIDDEQFAKQFGDEYLAQMICETSLMPGAMEMLKHLHISGAKMVVVSNGFKEVQYHKLERSGIRDFFEVVIISEEVGEHKPSPDIFRIALERLSGITFATNPDKWREVKKSTLMIGDDFENDIEGAQIFGIDQFFYNHKHRNCQGATYEADSLTPLLG